MPTYQIEHKTTGRVREISCSWDRFERLMARNPSYFQVVGTPGFSSGSFKPDDGFRDILRGIAKKHPGSTVDTF